MSKVDPLSRRQFLLGRFQSPRDDAAGEAVPGPGALQGVIRDYSGIIESMGSSSPVDGKPLIYSVTLDESQLRAVFDEIESSATHVAVRVKGAAQQMAEKTPLTLRQARAALRQGRGVQLRYRHKGVMWSDTYQATPEGIKLMRCQLPMDLDIS